MGLSAWFRRRASSRIVTLPREGRAVIVSDLHGHTGDWAAIQATTRALERIADGEDLYLLITGDVPDVARHRALDPAVPPDGDVRILDELVQLRAALGARAGRVIYLEGNHDFHVSRICHEVNTFLLGERGAPRDGAPLPVDPEAYQAFCARYRAVQGERIYENNVLPYDMVPRARREHLALFAAAPILAVLPGAGVLVTHAGPPRMAGWRAGDLERAIAGADRAAMRDAEPEAYYGAPYHQLLNGRFRGGDYGLHDVDAFLAAFNASLLVTGHTPHPYLIDHERGGALPGCSFQDGLGVIGERQVVLCSSFGAFRPGLKRVLELDLARRYDGAAQLLAEPGAVRPVYSGAAPAEPVLPGAALLELA